MPRLHRHLASRTFIGGIAMIQNNRRQFVSASSALFASADLSGTVRAAEVSGYKFGIQLYSLRSFDVTTVLNHVAKLGFQQFELYGGMLATS